MALSSNPHVAERSEYSLDNQIAILEAVKDAGAGGIPVSDLFGEYGDRTEVLEAMMNGIVEEYFDIQWTQDTNGFGHVLADQRLRDLDKSEIRAELNDSPAYR